MLRSIAVAVALICASSAQAFPPAAQIPQPDGVITQVAYGCGPGRTRVRGVCVARTTVRQARRAMRGAPRGPYEPIGGGGGQWFPRY